MRVPRLMGAVGMVIAWMGCWDSTSDPQLASNFSAVQQVFKASCAGCHDDFASYLSLGPVFRTDMDSAAVVASGFIDPEEPGRSIVILKPRDVVPHGGGRIASFLQADERILTEWIRRQPRLYNSVLQATRIAPSQAPVIDGHADEGAWDEASPITVPIGGGWADAREVTLRAAYDAEFIYLSLQWQDDKASERRQPWVKQSDGTWKTALAKPRPYDGHTWGSVIDAEASQLNYEEKVALIWNTYGASTVAGFDQAGCAVLCHDPRNDLRPGKTYNYTDENRAAKKYTNAPNEIADMWHWKLVRMNQHGKLDDQFVGYWQPYTGDPHQGGRGSDEGTGGYTNNPATSGRPTYRHPAGMTAPPYFILDSEKQEVTQAELDALPVGSMIPNMITSGPTGKRADVDARGWYDTSRSMWTLEIRRKLVTGDSKDVQFDNLLREYVFGVAVFDNAQIEHSYSSAPLRLIFSP